MCASITYLCCIYYKINYLLSLILYKQAKYRPVDLLEKEPLKVHLYTLLRCSAITVEQKVPN